VRAIATLPWAVANGLAITADRRRELIRALPTSELARAVAALSTRRGARLPVAEWLAGPNQNALDALSHSSVITVPDGRAALSAEVMMALPNTLSSAVVSCAELRIEDITVWGEALAARTAIPLDLRLSVGELFEFFAAAWQMATEVLPTSATDKLPEELPWAAVPSVELRVTVEHRHDAPGDPLQLDDLVDLAAFGTSDRSQLREMAVTITAPPQLDRSARRLLTRRGMVHMAQLFGFLEAAEDRF
jgi:hypothetical protein